MSMFFFQIYVNYFWLLRCVILTYETYAIVFGFLFYDMDVHVLSHAFWVRTLTLQHLWLCSQSHTPLHPLEFILYEICLTT
jgi:hypothetical protein